MTKKLRHVWVRIPSMPVLKRCSVCGWGWKFDQDNDFPCPGIKVQDWPGGLS